MVDARGPSLDAPTSRARGSGSSCFMKRLPNDFQCPTCGASLSPNAKSCGRCGARGDGSDWLRPEAYDGLDLGDDDFDYEDFLRREFGEAGKGGNWFTRMTPKERFWWFTAVILLAAFVAMALAGW